MDEERGVSRQMGVLISVVICDDEQQRWILILRLSGIASKGRAKDP